MFLSSALFVFSLKMCYYFCMKQKIEEQTQQNKVYNRRNFYCLRDSGIVYIFAFIAPLVFGLVFAYIAMFIASQTGVKFGEGSNIITELFNNYYWFSIPFMLMTEIAFLVVYFSFHKICKVSFSATSISFKKAKPLSAFLAALTGIVCVLGFMWLIEGCFGRMFDVIGIKSSDIGLPLSNVGWLFANLLILGVVPAIAEELLFRGIIFGGLREKFSATTSVLLCGLLFALLHQNITQFIYPFILGCVLSLVMEKTGNIIYPMLIHMFNNFTTIVASYILTNSGYEHAWQVFSTAWWGVICAILLAAVTCVLLWLGYKFYLSKHQKLEKEKVGDVPKQEAVMVWKFPLSLWCGMLIAVIMIVINLI